MLKGMTTNRSETDRPWINSPGIVGAVLLGLVFVGYGTYMHVTMGDRTLGACEVCNPWHPQWVVTPLVLGAALLVVGGYLVTRR